MNSGSFNLNQKGWCTRPLTNCDKHTVTIHLTCQKQTLIFQRHEENISIIKIPKENSNTAAAAKRRQQAWKPVANCVNAQIVRGTSRYDANCSCESHEINVLRKPCVYDNDSLVLLRCKPLSGEEKQGAGKKNKHKNINQRAKLVHFILYTE